MLTGGERAVGRRLVVVVVPAYDEAETIGETVEAVRALDPVLDELGLRLEIIVVDDGSRDGTGDLARAAGADRVVRHRVNRGLGAAVRSGLVAARHAGADLVVKFDADLQHDPADVPRLLRPILDDEADVVYGNRFPRIEYAMPWLRRIGNRLFTRLMAWLTRWPLEDSQPGILAVDRAYLEVFHLPGDYNYTQQILLDAYHKGMRFAHVPVRFRPRRSGRSFVSLHYPFKVLPQILLVLVGVRPLKVFVPLGLLFLSLGGAIFAVELGMWLAGTTAKPVLHVNVTLGLLLFGLQTFFFGLLAELIVVTRRERPR